MCQSKSIYDRRYLSKYPWIKSYFDARDRCNKPKNNRYYRYGARGVKFLITKEDFKKLWFRDKAYLMKKASIDRKDNDGNYTFENCQFIDYQLMQEKIKENRFFNTT